MLAHTKEARMCMVLQPGTAFRKVEDGEMFICLCNLRWAVLAWPITAVGQDGHHILDPAGQLSWHFVLNKDDFETALVVPTFLHGVGIAGLVSHWHEPLRFLLQHFSERLVYRDLQFLAKTCFEMTGVSAKTRRDLLEKLLIEVGGNEFAAQVLETLPTLAEKQKESEDDFFNQLFDAVLGQMDLAEQSEFKEIKQSLDQKEKAETTKRWQKWRKEAGAVNYFNCFRLQKTIVFPCPWRLLAAQG